MGAPASEETARRRGRPRPDETINRDELVLTRLREAGVAMTRDEVAQAAELTPAKAYLSLWRLRRDGHVQRVHQDGKHRWIVAVSQSP